MVLSSEKNYYEILEISTTASAVVIKSAYRKLVRKYHPDLNGGDKNCVEKFKEITEAYEILSDDDKKKHYDILRGFYYQNSQAKFHEANKAYKDPQNSSNPSSTNYKTEDRIRREERFSNVLDDIIAGFKNTTSTSNKQTYKHKTPTPERGKDIYSDVKITLHEAVNGTNRTINILHTQACPNCEGRPFINGGQCPVCKGLGEQSIHKKLNVKIPANVKQGSKIRIANEGNKGYNGGRNGDLYLTIKIEFDSNFKCEGLNLVGTVLIAPYEAVLGANIDVETPNGKISMRVLPNTHSGQKFRLAGQGLKQSAAEGGKTGDMIVTVNIETPQNLSEKEIELYKELKNISKTSVRENK